MILAVTVCWGAAYWDTFVRTVLPTLAPQVAKLGESFEWRIYTTRDEWIERQAQLPMEIEWSPQFIEPTAMGPLGGGYQGMLQLFRDAIDEARANDEPLLILPPDVVYSEGSLARAWKEMQSGARAVCVPRIRVDAAAVEHTLRGCGPLSGRELAVLAADNLHPLQQAMFADAERFTTWPSNICFRNPEWEKNPDSAFVVRAYHLFTLFARPTNDRQDWSNPDYDYVPKCCEGPVWAPASSDELLAVDLARPGHLVAGEDRATNLIGDGPYNANRVGAWVAGHTMPWHRELFEHEYRVIAHLGDRP